MRYLGPADFFVYDGKTYERGANVPITKEIAKHHVLQGDRFEDLDIAMGPVDVVAPDPPRSSLMPAEDNGTVDPKREVVRVKDQGGDKVTQKTETVAETQGVASGTAQGAGKP